MLNNVDSLNAFNASILENVELESVAMLENVKLDNPTSKKDSVPMALESVTMLDSIELDSAETLELNSVYET